jgi:NAD(P)-dependent dehydrogenase (short-subunit alcohol dehydrogenase family)
MTDIQNLGPGSVAVVTGAGSGIGRALANLLVSKGVRVLGLARHIEGLEESVDTQTALGTPMTPLAVDASDDGALAEALKPIDGFDRVDALFNVAGIMIRKPLIEATSADVQRQFMTNVGSVVAMSARFVPRMPDGAVIVNVGSSTAGRPRANLGLYGASKRAMEFITGVMAIELADRSIRVIGAGFGGVDTPMPVRARGMDGAAGHDAIQQAVNATQIIRRVASPEEVADVLYLLAGPAAALATGSMLWFDGGGHIS